MRDDTTTKMGDRFLRTTADGEGFWKGGEIGTVGPSRHCFEGPCLWSDDWTAVLPTAAEIASGDWRRVPPGYVVPPISDLLAGVVRLVEAYRAMLADPETGAAGVDATVRQMAAMAGIEVGA
jgi:hypothetical protein